MNTKKLSDIKYSVLDLAGVPAGRTPADTFKNSLDLARLAEQLGYTRYWLAEHHNMESVASSATSVLIGYLAGGTSTIRVGSGGIMLPNHAPLVVAEQFGTLESLYPGRIDLGLGRAPGTDQLTAMALRRGNLAAGEHFLDNILELQNYFSPENRHGKVRAFPGEGLEIPIWILGSSTDSARLAGMLGLPYAFASHFAPAHFYAALDLYRKSFRPSAVLKEPYVIACVNVVAAEDDETASYLATSLQRLFLGIVTGKRTLLMPPVANLDELWTEHEAAAVWQMLAFSFIGGREKIQSELEEFVTRMPVDEIMATSHIFDHQARLRSYEIFAKVFG